MRVIEACASILDVLDGDAILQKIESIGRICYKSEDRIQAGSAPVFVKMLIDRGHEAMLEHFSFSVKFVVDRGVSHELVRHRIASFAQESTRYCNYGKAGDVTFIVPCFWKDDSSKFEEWRESMSLSEDYYLHLLENGATPQEARSVLPNSLKTEIVISANLREWRHILRLRSAPAAHPQMREVMLPLLSLLQKTIPVIFDDIKGE